MSVALFIVSFRDGEKADGDACRRARGA